MFRVETELGERRVRLIVSGEVSSESIETLENCCDQAIKAGKSVDLVLRDVTTIDEFGRALLLRLAAKSVRISAKGVYHSYLVETIRRAVSRDSDKARESFQ